MVAAMNTRPSLSLFELEAFDPQAPTRSGERRFCCPLPACASKSVIAAHRALSVNLSSEYWHCHRCGAEGRLWEQGVRPRQAGRLRGMRSSTPNEPLGGPPTNETWRRAWDRTSLLTGTPGVAYLSRRGIGLAVADAAGVRYAPAWPLADQHGSTIRAVIFPLVNERQEVVAAHGRSIMADDKITLGPKSYAVFATVAAFDAPRLAIAESPIDALSFAVLGLPALALCGTSAPDWLPTALAFRHILLATDADAAGDAAASDLAPKLRSFGVQVERWRPIGVKDVNELLTGNPSGLASWLAEPR